MIVLRRGSEGNWVRYLQNSLRSLGYGAELCKSDGIFGDGTDSAVRNFQRDNGLSVDGIVEERTWGKIKEYIKPIQEKLISLGYNVGKSEADGIYGDLTVEAVRNFQKDKGLPEDGIAGPNTQRVLNDSSNALALVYNTLMGKVKTKK